MLRQRKYLPLGEVVSGQSSSVVGGERDQVMEDSSHLTSLELEASDLVIRES